jgi:hypothetical protein
MAELSKEEMTLMARYHRNLMQEVHDKLREVLGKDGPTLTATAPETKKSG